MGRRVWKIFAAWPMCMHRGRPRRWMPKGRVEFDLVVKTVRFRLTSIPFKGICVIARYRPGDVRCELAVPDERWEFPSMKKKTTGTAAVQVKHLAALESDVFKGLLPIVEHMAVRQYEDGDPREPGWVTIKTQGSAWVVQIKDPDACVSFSAVAETLDKALETAALLLSCDDAPWEQDKWLVDAAARRKKK